MSGRHRGLTSAEREAIEHRGGVIRDNKQGYEVLWPDKPQLSSGFAAKDVEAAITRAREYGTTFIRLWRERGDGWYAATSHAEHPGYSYVCRIDERTGQPISCECIANAGCCHHLGAVVAAWREQSGWVANDEAILAAWEETLRMVCQRMPSRMQTEEW